jgi:hypothetical protein
MRCLRCLLADAYGAGDKLLRHRYADVIAAYGSSTGRATSPAVVPGPPDDGRGDGRGQVALVARRVIRVARNKLTRGRTGVAETVWRVGERLGHLCHTIDADATVLESPGHGPRAKSASPSPPKCAVCWPCGRETSQRCIGS